MYHWPSSSLNNAGSHGPGGTSPGFIASGALSTEPGSDGIRRTRKSSRPLSGAVDETIEPGSVIDGCTTIFSPSDQTAGATMPLNGHRLGVINVQSMRSVERQ